RTGSSPVAGTTSLISSSPLCPAPKMEKAGLTAEAGPELPCCDPSAPPTLLYVAAPPNLSKIFTPKEAGRPCCQDRPLRDSLHHQPISPSHTLIRSEKADLTKN